MTNLTVHEMRRGRRTTDRRSGMSVEKRKSDNFHIQKKKTNEQLSQGQHPVGNTASQMQVDRNPHDQERGVKCC